MFVLFTEVTKAGFAATKLFASPKNLVSRERESSSNLLQTQILEHDLTYDDMCDFSRYGGKSAEWQRLEATLPVPPEMSMETLQNTTNATREAASSKAMERLSTQVAMTDYSVPTRDGSTIKVRSYRPTTSEADNLPIYVHFHGGGFFFGTLDSENATCASIAVDVGLVVVNVNYRHTPKHAYPTPYDDSEDAIDWIVQHATDFGGDCARIVVGGISAGAALTVALMQTLQRRDSSKTHRILGQVLMIPLVVHEDCSEPLFRKLKEPAKSSYSENEFAPILPLTRIRMFNGLLHHQPPGADDRRANAGLASAADLAGLPPAAFGICGLDPLRDEGLLYAKMLHENG